MDMPVNVPVDDPNADTEWNDILRKHGVIPEKPPSPTPVIEEALAEARRLAHENRLEGKDLDELKALEDEEDEDFLNQYKQKRLAELSSLASASIYNQVYHLQKPDYSRDVTEVSAKSYVLVLLTSEGRNVESRILIEIWQRLASRFGDIKFCQMQANMCIEGYPERNTPTILVYKNGDIIKQIVTLKELKGLRTSIEDIQSILVNLEAVKSNDHRLQEDKFQSDGGTGRQHGSIRQGNGAVGNEDDDSDWD